MNITLSVSGELEKMIKEHPEIKWTELARQGMISEIERFQKTNILKKMIEREPFTNQDIEWMDKNDWHPVDEMELKPEFIKKVEQRSKNQCVRVKTVKDVFKK
ncbi:MAG: hypothetical protein V1870_01575 [Candidatus Aenigmatarchaeota archaeon]